MLLGLIPALYIAPVQAVTLNYNGLPQNTLTFPNNAATGASCNLRYYATMLLANPLMGTGSLTQMSDYSPFCIFLHPGIADAYNSGWSHTLGTLYGVDVPLNQKLDQQRQVFDKYLDYAILASGSDSIGDLQFDFAMPTHANVSSIQIFVPPEFTFKGPTAQESVWSDITNDYQFITISTRSAYDMVAPGWTRVEVGQEGGWNMTEGIYHIRLMDLSAPTVAGLYFFKIAWYDTADNLHVLNAADYPFVVVKTDLNPAYIEVTVRTSGHNAFPYTSGEVVAVGTTPDGRSVAGGTYWGPGNWIDNSMTTGNTGAEYKTWIFGLAAGTYTLTAQASGFLPTTTDRLTLDAGQSYQAYIVVSYSPEVTVTVWSKHGTGAVPWGNLWQLPYGTNNPDIVNTNATWRDIMLELYDTNNNLLAFWASNVLGSNDTVPFLVLAGLKNYGGFDSQSVGPVGPLMAGLGNPNGGYKFSSKGVPKLLHPGPSPAWLHGIGATKSIAATTKLLGFHDNEAPNPTAVSYYAKLCDNFDVLGFVRMYPSTHWDGHVPWATADYVAGYANGDYTVEGFVTGYIMDQADAYQRAFSVVGSSISLQFDLRRSNWLEVSMHDTTDMSVPTTVTLTATDTGGNERGAIAFLADSTMIDTISPLTLDGQDAVAYYNKAVAGSGTGTVVPYYGGIIIEGYNGIFPYVGGRSGAKDINKKDYGLNPTASTHSSGAVTLAGNPYTIKLYMADMGVPYNPPLQTDPTKIDYGYAHWNATGWYSIVGGDPQASVFLCNSRVSLSFIITNAHVVISIRSVDFEVPAHSRPWTFPGSEIYVNFMDMNGNVIDSLNPILYGLFQDPGWLNMTAPLVAVPVLIHGDNYWPIPGVTYPQLANHGVGWTPFDYDSVNLAGQHEHLLVPYFGTDWCSNTIWGGDPIYYCLLPSYRSTSLPAGEYTFQAFTHGYIMRRSFPVQIPASGEGDIEADMIQGGQIRVTVDFLHEAVPTVFNGFLYAEAYDSAGNFVGASIYGQAQPNIFTRSTNGGGYLDYDPTTDWTVVQGPAQATGLNPWNEEGFSAASYTGGLPNGGVTIVNNDHDISTPTACFNYPSCSYAQRAYYAWLIHTSGLYGGPAPEFNYPPYTWANWMGSYQKGAWLYTVPWNEYFPANRLEVPASDSQSMDIYGFYQYYGNAVRTWAGGWPVPAGGTSVVQNDTGLRGSVDVPGWTGSGAGLYTVKVWAFDPRGPNNKTDTGTFSDDWRMYSMATTLTNVQVPWGGAVALSVDMNDMATLTGTVRWFDMYGNLYALPWAQVTASPGPSTDQYPAYQTGSYIMWLPAGSHDVSVGTSEAPQVWSSAAPTQNAAYTVVVSPGWMGGGDSQLSTSGTPVPEVPAFAAPLALFAVLAASVWLLRKKSNNIPVLMK
jgi:hypothetical protein